MDHNCRLNHTGVLMHDRYTRGFKRKLGPTEKFLSAAAFLIGGGALLLFAFFLLFGSLNLVDLQFDEQSRLVFDAALCLLFFLQHSLMTRGSFRRRLIRIVKEDYQGALFSIVSGITLFVFVLLWQGSDLILLSPDGLVRWLWHSLFVIGLAVFIWGSRSLGSFDSLGTRTIRRGPDDDWPHRAELAAEGAYRWVRHPQYAGTVLMIWSLPHLTADRLLFNILFSCWIVIGARLEEKDLVAEFGSAYRAYQQQVPMLIPRPPGKRIAPDDDNE